MTGLQEGEERRTLRGFDAKEVAAQAVSRTDDMKPYCLSYGCISKRRYGRVHHTLFTPDPTSSTLMTQSRVRDHSMSSFRVL